MRHVNFSLILSLILLSGCDKKAETVEAREERDPYVKAGQQFMEEQKWQEAVDSFKMAIEKDPLMARPHLDLAIIYQNLVQTSPQVPRNYIHAIYHYDRYLELRPTTEKADMIQQQNAKILKAFANLVISSSPDIQNLIKERETLLQTVKELKSQLASPQNQTAAAPVQQEAGQNVTQTVPKSADSSAAASTGNPEIYHVVSGDTLSTIAAKFYGNSGKWDIIFQANSDRLASPNDLKAGQTLVIPRLNN